MRFGCIPSYPPSTAKLLPTFPAQALLLPVLNQWSTAEKYPMRIHYSSESIQPPSQLPLPPAASPSPSTRARLSAETFLLFHHVCLCPSLLSSLRTASNPLGPLFGRARVFPLQLESRFPWNFLIKIEGSPPPLNGHHLSLVQPQLTQP